MKKLVKHLIKTPTILVKHISNLEVNYCMLYEQPTNIFILFINKFFIIKYEPKKAHYVYFRVINKKAPQIIKEQILCLYTYFFL